MMKTIPKILKNPQSIWWDNKTTNKIETFEEIIVDAWLRAVRVLKT